MSSQASVQQKLFSGNRKKVWNFVTKIVFCFFTSLSEKKKEDDVKSLLSEFPTSFTHMLKQFKRPQKLVNRQAGTKILVELTTIVHQSWPFSFERNNVTLRKKIQL